MIKKAALFIGLFVGGCDGNDIYTLYRSSPNDLSMRIHVATFDAKDGAEYNSGNCDIARDLFQGQEGVLVKYWCEKGRYKK